MIFRLAFFSLILSVNAAAFADDEPKIDAPTQWREWAASAKAKAEAEKPEYERVKALYDRVLPHREIRRRLFHEADFEFADQELPKLFAKIADPLAAHEYSLAISALGAFSFDTEPEDLRATMRKWTEVKPNSHYAWLVRGRQAISYAWYWRGSGYSSTVSDEAWQHVRTAVQEARRSLEKSYSLEPKDPESSHNMMSVCVLESGSREEMEKYFARTLALAPSHWGAYTEKFQYLRPVWFGSWPEYQTELHALEAKAAERNDPILRSVAVAARRQLEDEQNGAPSEATQRRRALELVDVYKAWLDRWPDDPNCHGYYIEVLYDAQRQSDLWEQFQWLGHRFPMAIRWDLLTYHRNRIHSLLMHADALPADARLKEFDRIIALDPKWERTYQFVGAARAKRGENEAAESAYRKALEINPDGGFTYYLLAVLYERMGQSDDSLKMVQKAREYKQTEMVTKDLVGIEERLLKRVGDAFKPIEIPEKK